MKRNESKTPAKSQYVEASSSDDDAASDVVYSPTRKRAVDSLVKPTKVKGDSARLRVSVHFSMKTFPLQSERLSACD